MLITIAGKSRKFFAMRISATGFLVLLLMVSCARVLRAQAIQIKLVNGKTGRAITDRSLLNVWVGHVRQLPFMVSPDKHGVAVLRLSPNDSEINVAECRDEKADTEKLLSNPTKQAKKEFNEKYKNCVSLEVDNPVARYADSISVQTLPGDISWKAGGRSIAYVPCWVDSKKAYWTNIEEFSTEDVLQKGVVTANTCGKATVSANPGEIILFVMLPSNGESWRQIWD